MDQDGVFSPAEKSRSILVVDDDPQVLKWVCKMLDSCGAARVLPALSGAQALQIWEAHRSEISVLVSDFVMPGLTGDHLALRLLQEKPGLRVLFISGNDPGSLHSEIPLNGQNFLQKPFTVTQINRSLQKLALAE